MVWLLRKLGRRRRSTGRSMWNRSKVGWSRSSRSWGRSLVFVRTHWPGEAERQDHSGLGASRREAVAAQHWRGGGAEAAGASGSGLELELL